MNLCCLSYIINLLLVELSIKKKQKKKQMCMLDQKVSNRCFVDFIYGPSMREISEILCLIFTNSGWAVFLKENKYICNAFKIFK